MFHAAYHVECVAVVKRARKREESLERNESGGDVPTVGDYINDLHSVFIFDTEKIWNTQHEDVLETIMQIEADYPDKLDVIMKKAIRKTKVKERDRAYQELAEFITD